MANENKDASKKTPGLRVTAKVEGFRRAGRSWSKAPTELPTADFTAEQIAALKAEPMLVVEEIEMAAAEPEK